MREIYREAVECVEAFDNNFYVSPLVQFKTSGGTVLLKVNVNNVLRDTLVSALELSVEGLDDGVFELLVAGGDHNIVHDKRYKRIDTILLIVPQTRIELGLSATQS